jgi:hypothetical protein
MWGTSRAERRVWRRSRVDGPNVASGVLIRSGAGFHPIVIRGQRPESYEIDLPRTKLKRPSAATWLVSKESVVRCKPGWG